MRRIQAFQNLFRAKRAALAWLPSRWGTWCLASLQVVGVCTWQDEWSWGEVSPLPRTFPGLWAGFELLTNLLSWCPASFPSCVQAQ